jgi:hypothetical protein
METCSNCNEKFPRKDGEILALRNRVAELKGLNEQQQVTIQQLKDAKPADCPYVATEDKNPAVGGTVWSG